MLFRAMSRTMLTMLVSLGLAVAAPVAATASQNHKSHAAKRHKKKSNRGRRGPRGFRGPAGKTGPTGPQGPIGPQGPAGPSHQLYYDAIAAVGHEVTLAQVGPFKFIGKCIATEISAKAAVAAGTFLATSEEHTAIDDYEQAGSVPDFGPATAGTTFGKPTGETAVPGELAISYEATALAGERAFEGPSDGSTSGVSANGQVWFNAFIATGVRVGQATEAEPCLFQGHVDSPSIG